MSLTGTHILGLAPLLLLTACSLQPYTIVFNDNVLYSPNEILQQGILRDAGLQACLNQAMQSNELDDATGVTLLACPGVGVQSLAGIEALVNLEQLEISDNNITNLSPLLPLKNLRVLSMRNNAIGDIRPLSTLPILRFVSLEGNDRIPCGQLNTLQEKLGDTLSRPLSCVN